MTLEFYRGVWLVNLRKWYEADSGELRPSKQGIAFRLKHLPRVAEALASVKVIAQSRGVFEHEPQRA